MAFNGLNEYIDFLKSKEEIIIVDDFVSTELEITEIADRFSSLNDGGKAILFTNTESKFPLLIGGLGSEKRMCYTLGAKNLDEFGDEIQSLFTDFTKPQKNIINKISLLPKLGKIASYMPKSVKKAAKCQEVIIKEVDLNIFPILKCWPYDGGKFITFPIVHTKDPITNIRNVGMYRMQVLDNKTTGMHWHLHKTGARHYREYKKLGKIMPIAVCLGGDPIYTYSATAPLPDNLDEYLFAGFLRKKKIELVKCITQDIEVPIDADIVIEGYVDPKEELIYEGPFGDHTGYYSLADYYPKFHITCITHRKNAIYPTTIVGIPPQEDAWIGKATERLFLPLIQKSMVNEIIDWNLPFAGVAHNIVIVKIEKTYNGQAQKVMNALWGAGQMMFTKLFVIIDENINVHNYNEVLESIIKNVDPEKDIFFSKGPMDVLDHSSNEFTFGSKMGIDATVKGKNNNYTSAFLDTVNIKNKFPQITCFNTEFLGKGFPLLLVNIEKNEFKIVKKLHNELCSSNLVNGVKFIAYFDKQIDLKDLFSITWRFWSNFDPSRDTYIHKTNSYTIYGFDGTHKTKKLDDFNRDWPNIVTMNIETIEKIDKKWNTLFSIPLINSPSRKYIPQKINEGDKVI